MIKEEIEKLANTPLLELVKSVEIDYDSALVGIQELAKIVLKQAGDLKNQTETIKRQREEIRRLTENSRQIYALQGRTGTR